MREFCRRLFKSPQKNRRRSQVYSPSPFDDEDDEYIDNIEDSTPNRPQVKSSSMTPCKSSERGLLHLSNSIQIMSFFSFQHKWRITY